MAIPSVLAGQKCLGGWIPADPMTTIIVGKKGVGTEIGVDSGTPFFAVFSSTGFSASGPSDVPCELDVPVYYDYDAGKYICVKMPVPANIGTVVIDTFPNTPENNDKYRDIAFNGFEYVPINTTYSESQFAYLPAEGVGINGTYDFAGGVSLSGNRLYVSASGFTNAKVSGDVDFWVNASVIIDGNIFEKKALQRSGDEIWNENRIPVGSTIFELPEPVGGQRYSLLLEGGYTYGTPGSPMVMPMPMSTTHEISLKVRVKSK